MLNEELTEPQVRDEVAKLLKETKDAMEILGDRRDTPEKQRGVLLEIVAAFQDITSNAIATNYGAHEIFEANRLAR